MSREYAEDKIREALRINGGNIALSRKQIMIWAHDDAALMRAIASPHLDGIIAYQVERVASGRAELENRHPSETPKEKPKEDDNFGMNLLRAVAASDATVFGQDNVITPKRKQASKQHIDAIHKMVASGGNISKKKS